MDVDIVLRSIRFSHIQHMAEWEDLVLKALFFCSFKFGSFMLHGIIDRAYHDMSMVLLSAPNLPSYMCEKHTQLHQGTSSKGNTPERGFMTFPKELTIYEIRKCPGIPLPCSLVTLVNPADSKWQ